MPLSSLQLIFRELPKAEVFLTLAVGWIAAYLRTAAGAREIVRNSLGLRTEATDEEIEEQLLGGEGTDAKLRVVQKLLHDAFVQGSGARYATPFFIVSGKAIAPTGSSTSPTARRPTMSSKSCTGRSRIISRTTGIQGLRCSGSIPAESRTRAS